MRTSDLLRRFPADRGGSVAIIFALSLIPLLGLVGAAIDYSRATVEREKIQRALDATVLAVNRQIGKMELDDLETYAQNMLDANLQGASASIDGLEIDANTRMVLMSASTGVDTSFLKLLNIDVIDVGATAQSVTGSSSIEIALVLDNSGSMAGSRISTLRRASQDLVRTLFGTDPVSETVSIALVPFAGTVNVGAEYDNATWMDRNALSPIHQGMFVSPVNRFDLYDDMRNTNWKGCVEVRPEPYHATDDAPDPAVPEMLFVPSFAPDEPDQRSNPWGGGWGGWFGWGGGYGGSSPFANSYLDDTDGNCPSSVRNMPDVENTGQICKYDNERPANGSTGATDLGPNYLCDSEPVSPLTNVKSDLLSSIGQMHAKGNTNIFEGIMWGWRTLSPGAPFEEGFAYDAENNGKYMIVMTDGANTVPESGGDLDSAYTAFGHANLGRLGDDRSNRGLVEKMNEYTLEACTNAKAAGIKVFTIAFDLDDDDTVEMLAACASKRSYAYEATSTSELTATFAEIAGALGELRIAN